MNNAMNNHEEISNDTKTAAMLEKIYSDFKVFGEDMDFIKKKVESTWIQTGKNSEEITMLRIDVNILKTDMTALKTDGISINGRLIAIEDDIKTIKKDVADIKSDLCPRVTRLESLIK